MIVDPAALLPVKPTATQSINVEHETPVTSISFDGGA
jgi:hypothetical protein